MFCKIQRIGFLLIGLLCCHPSIAVCAGFPKTLDWETQEFKRVIQKIADVYDEGTALDSAAALEEPRKREITCGGAFSGKTRLGLIEKDGDRMYVTFKGVDSWCSRALLSYLFLGKTKWDALDNAYGHRGVLSLFETIKADLERRLRIRTDEPPLEYVFSGYGVGGALALYAATSFSAEHRGKLVPNQVKVVTFSSPKVADENLKNWVHELIGQRNIVQFLNRLDLTTISPFFYRHVGLPIYILPSERWRDAYLNTARWVTFISKGVAILYIAQYLRNCELINRDAWDVAVICKELTNWMRNLTPTTLIKWGGAFVLFKPLFRSVADLPSELTIRGAIHHTRINVENALSNGSSENCLPQDAGKVGYFDIRRSLSMQTISRYY